MPTITNAASVGATTSTEPAKPTSGVLDKDGFLKLLTVQLRQQDPMSAAQDPSQSINQMTQFSMLEQITNLAKATEQADAAARMDHAVGLLGRTVTVRHDGQAHTGTVERVDVVAGKPSLTVAGVAGIDPSTLTEVR
jgi:flagellar basal-body rod modification protein FlgD